MDYKALREYMVRTQLIPRGITDTRVLDAMKRIPRHLFVPEHIKVRSYDDMALSIGEGQTISQPYMVAVMTELLQLEGNEKVLEIGTGSGYQTSVLAELAKSVYTIERIDALAIKAEEILRSLFYEKVHIKVGDGTMGWPEEAPFDRILVTAGAPQLPAPLIEQLSDNDGIIIAPVGDRSSQQLIKMIKTKSGIREERHTPCVFVPLIGEYGWDKEGEYY